LNEEFYYIMKLKMPKNIQDIVVTERRKSIRDVPMPEGRRKTDVKEHSPRSTASAPVDIERNVIREKTSLPKLPKRRRKLPSKKIWVSAIIILLLGAFILMSMFKGATLAYTPKSAPLVFDNDSYIAKKSADGGLLYSVVKLSGEREESVPATGQEQVSRKASGTIVVYNNNADQQRLVENTRFESEDGKVYRIQSAITVPARRTVAGSSQPGSIEVTVYADEPGASHNIGLTDFTLPGLRGTARYTTVYARSKTVMSGGLVGEVAKIDPNVLEATKARLEHELNEELSQLAAAQVPSDFILFPSLSITKFDGSPQIGGGASSANVVMKGDFYGVMFKKSDLATFLGTDKSTVLSGESVDIPSLEQLQFSFNGNPPADLLNSTQISFIVNGSATLLWRTNEEALKSELLGKHKSEISSILENYPTITTAEAMIRPFWKSSFPDDSKNVSIKRMTIQ
jgi:hypothetical protein